MSRAATQTWPSIPTALRWARTGLGATLGMAVRRDTNMFPVRQIQGVSTHKAGLAYTRVRVVTGGDATEFRVSKRQAEEVKATLLRLENTAMCQPARARMMRHDQRHNPRGRIPRLLRTADRSPA